jgi:hypothetical protein
MKAYFLLFIPLNDCKSDKLFEKSGCNPMGKLYNKGDHRNAAKEKNHAGAKLQPIDHLDYLDIAFFDCAFMQPDCSIEQSAKHMQRGGNRAST